MESAGGAELERASCVLEDELIQLPMCLHENLIFPVLYPVLTSVSLTRGTNSIDQVDFSFLFSPLSTVESESDSDRTTPESFNQCSREISPALPFERQSDLHSMHGALSIDVALDLKHEAIHKYFTLLLEWARDAMKIASAYTSPSPLLLYEDMYFSSREESLFGSLEQCTEISLLSYRDSYLLLVHGTSFAVHDRVNSLDKMIVDASKVRNVHHLIGWQERHCEALAMSDHLKNMQTATRACVVFRARQGAFASSDVKMIAEVVSLQPYQSSGLVKALNILLPTIRVVDVVGDPSAVSRVPWESLRASHAIVSDWTGSGSTLLHLPSAIRLWGFEGIIDEAVAEIRRIISPNAGQTEVPKPNPWLNLPLSVTQPCVSVIECVHTLSSTTVTSTTVTSVTESTDKDTIRKKFVGGYSFRDREAGIFFYSFEKQFHAYIHNTFSVVIIEEDFKESKKEIEDGNRNAVLKISFHGPSQLSVSATRSYLDQLNPHNLHRVQVFMPMVSVSKYKELLTRRSIELSALSDVRHTSLQKLGGTLNSHPTVDPMQFHGAINIRIKPPMHSGGVSRIPLPADCTITICGSVLVKEHMNMIQAIEKRFNDIPCEHLVETLTLAYGHPLKKQLTVKASRDAFIKQYGLMGLKWDEGNRATGSMGVAKLWAGSRSIMNAALAAIHEVTQSWTASTPPALDEVEHWPPLAKENTENCPCKSILEWPNPALRYALLSNPLSGELNDLIKKWTDAGVACKYPFRDRTNPNAGILLQGNELLVPQASREVDNFLKRSSAAMKCVHIIVPHMVYSNLIAKDLSGVKFIQGQAGVYMGMNCSVEEAHRDAHSLVDLRLSSTRNCLLSLRVDNSNAHHSLDVIVVVSSSQDVGLSWGAKHELVIIDGAASPGTGTYSQRDEEQLANGRIQIHTDAHTCKTTLRVMLLKQTDESANKVPDFEANVNRVVKGLEKADALSLKGLSVVMSPEVCTTGVAAVIKFARKSYTVHSVSRIVCVERTSNDQPLPPSVAVGSGSYVAEAMLKLIEEKQRVSGSNIVLLTANTPLPVPMKVAPFGQVMARYSQGPKSSSGSFPTVSGVGGKWGGDQSILVRGIESSVLKALESLREMMRSGRCIV